MPIPIQNTAKQIRTAAKLASAGLVERESLIDLILLCAVAGEHLLIVGPPGTAKSAAVRQVASIINGKYFEYLLGRFTEPSELFGPIDLRKLKDGVIETATEGMLPEADIVFLDEVFLGSTAVLNTLLGILNERIFRRGSTNIVCPLQVCVAAANHLPEDESLAAFSDRFLVNYHVESVADSQLELLLTQGWKFENTKVQSDVTIESIRELSSVAQKAEMSSATTRLLADCIRLLRKENIILSDRRIVKSQRLVSAAAVLDGRDKPTEADLWPLIYAIQSKADQLTAREILKEKIAMSMNETLSAAAEQASKGPLARAQNLIDKAEGLLESENREANLLSLEAIGREIDANFSLSTMPDNLKVVREKLIDVLGLVE